jgi:hypothetical protein
MKCKVSSISQTKNHFDIGFFVDFVIQQSTAGTASAQLSNEKIEFIKKLGLNAKENMSFTSFSTDTDEAQ